MSDAPDLSRPYLVIPKLIEQPTWGGDYIAKTKRWDKAGFLAGKKVGQSYELFSGSNLSLLDSSADPAFRGELTDRDAVQVQTSTPNSVQLRQLLQVSAKEVLGAEKFGRDKGRINLLIKFTQALGNSFQIHVKVGQPHLFWKPKPESWYYFEPGLITAGVKAGIDWDRYEQTLIVLDAEIKAVGQRVKSGDEKYSAAQDEIKNLLKRYDPWQFVNLVKVKKGQLFDLSTGGMQHSWEENLNELPLGNVLYELQSEAMDDISTIRSFDQGKMSPDGSTRQLHIKDYFELIDRSAKSNDPANHLLEAETLADTGSYKLERLLKTNYYCLDKLTFLRADADFTEDLDGFRHLFVKEGSAQVKAGNKMVELTRGHSCFVPASCGLLGVKAAEPKTEILVSF